MFENHGNTLKKPQCKTWYYHGIFVRVPRGSDIPDERDAGVPH